MVRLPSQNNDDDDDVTIEEGERDSEWIDDFPKPHKEPIRETPDWPLPEIPPWPKEKKVPPFP